MKDKEMVFGGWDVLYDLRGGRHRAMNYILLP